MLVTMNKNVWQYSIDFRKSIYETSRILSTEKGFNSAEIKKHENEIVMGKYFP